MDRIDLTAPSVNGTVKTARKSNRKANKPQTTIKPRRASLRGRQRIALFVGGVGISGLILSLWHCTSALASLTGSPIPLAALLAVCIDAGMVACELAAIAADGEARRWAHRYIALAVALSIALNAFAAVAHAERWPWLAAPTGAVIPVLVYIAARVAGHLWRD
jgi:hypothetical protein